MADLGHPGHYASWRESPVPWIQNARSRDHSLSQSDLDSRLFLPNVWETKRIIMCRGKIQLCSRKTRQENTRSERMYLLRIHAHSKVHGWWRKRSWHLWLSRRDLWFWWGLLRTIARWKRGPRRCLWRVGRRNWLVHRVWLHCESQRGWLTLHCVISHSLSLY